MQLNDAKIQEEPRLSKAQEELYLVGALALVSAFLYRFRGGGFGAEKLPGHPRFYVAPAMFFVTWAFTTWDRALVFAACYLAFQMLPWGRWFSLGRAKRGFQGREVSWFEALVETAAEKLMRGGDYQDHAALLIRHWIASFPLSIGLSAVTGHGWMVGFLHLPFCFLIVLIYEWAWQHTDFRRGENPIQLAEIATGALFGLLQAWVILS